MKEADMKENILSREKRCTSVMYHNTSKIREKDITESNIDAGSFLP
jgi:hypothetical protein